MDFASLGIRVDSAEVKTGATELDKLTSAADRAEAATKGVGPAVEAAGRQVQRGGAAAASAASGFGQQEGQIKAATLSAKQYSQAMRMLPAQITDIVTSLASGSPAYLVAIQQGGQLRDSFGGFGETLRALATVITPVRIAIGAVAGIAGLVAKGFLDGQREGFGFEKALVLTGNAAGVTSDQLARMSENIDDIVDTQAASADALTQLASTGKVAAENLEAFATVALQLKRTVGQPVEDTVKIFDELARRPVEASLKLNESYNHLTEGIYTVIKALQDQGRIQEAGEVAQKAYAAASAQRTDRLEGELGTLQRTAKATGAFFREMWDSILNVGRPLTISDQIKDVERQIREASAGASRLDTDDGFGGASGGRERTIKALQDQRAELEKLRAAEEQQARAEADRARAFKQFVNAREEALRIDKERRAVLEQTSRAQVGFDINAIQRQLSAVTTAYANYESILEAQRQAGLISETAYYEARRSLINRDSAARIQAFQEENARIAEENRRLEAGRSAAGSEAYRTGKESDRISAESAFTQELLVNQERIKANEAEIAQLRARSAAETQVLGIEQKAANDALVNSYKDARAAAQAYLDVLTQQRQRELDGMGKGDRQREIDNSRSDIDEKFAAQRLQLESDRRTNPQLTQEMYDQQLEIIDEFHQKALAANDSYYEQLEEKQGSFFVGASEAVANYIDSAKNVAGSTRDAFAHAFESAEDAVLKFARTGKLSVKDLADSIIAEFLRIQIRTAIANVAGGSFMSLFGGLLGAGFGSVGGTGAGGGSGILPGEHDWMNRLPGGGPLFADVGIRRVPRDNQVAILHKNEAVIPAAMNPFAGGRGFGGSPMSFHTTINADAGTNVAQLGALLDQRDAQIKAEIAESMHRNRPGWVN